MNNLNQKLLFLSKRVLPDKLRAKAIINYQRALHWAKYGDPNFARSIALEISVFCNRTCYYCPNSTHDTPKIFMSEEIFELCLTRLQELRWTGVVDYMFYNEPMADKRLAQFVAQTRRALPDAKPRVITNGDYLTRDNLMELIKAGVINFSLSRHVPFNENWDRKIAGLIREFPDYIYLNNMEGRTDLTNRGGQVKIEGYIPRDTCDAPSTALNILHNGDVILCCCDYQRRYVFGNIVKSSIREIWVHPEFVRQRNNVRYGTPEYDICKGCFGITPTPTHEST